MTDCWTCGREPPFVVGIRVPRDREEDLLLCLTCRDRMWEAIDDYESKHPRTVMDSRPTGSKHSSAGSRVVFRGVTTESSDGE